MITEMAQFALDELQEHLKIEMKKIDVTLKKKYRKMIKDIVLEVLKENNLIKVNDERC